jgi:glycosyltransferase involved in cell wall biosynthesis
MDLLLGVVIIDRDRNQSGGFLVDMNIGLQRPLRIACVTETWPPEVNGVAMTIARLVQSLRDRRHTVQVVRPRQAGDVGASSVDGHADVLVRGVPIPNYAGLRIGLPCKNALVKLWRQQRPDVVHIATEGPLGRSALLAAKALGLPVCSDFRTNFHAYSKHYGLGFLRRPIMAYLRRFHNATQCTMVPTQALHDDLRQAGFRDLMTVARGVDVRRFDTAYRSAALRAQWGVATDDPVVICVGRLAPEKNLTTLVSAFEAIRRDQPRARLVLVGDGPMRKELQTRCPDAIFAGQRTGEDLAAHYASADLFLFPSVTETFGNVTTEAMASGLAVVAFDYAAAAGLIRHGENGALVPYDNSAAFVTTAARTAVDLANCRVLGERARISVMALDWDSIAAQVEGVMHAVMHRVEPATGYASAPARHASV